MVVLLILVMYADCYNLALYAECHYAECRYDKCRYAECRGAVTTAGQVVYIFNTTKY